MSVTTIGNHKTNVYITNLSNFNLSVEFFTNDNNNKIPEVSNNILYYRIKNQNRNIDVDLFNTLKNQMNNPNTKKGH